MSAESCTKCGAAMAAGEAREYMGRVLCEDCYVDALSPAVTCDPWAVHTARSLKDLPGGHALTHMQQQLYDLVKERGEVPIPEACAHLGLKEAALRHMEKLKACRKDDSILITLF
jgi:hypothetical protein